MKQLLSVLFVILLMSVSAKAQTYYVSNAGDDANDCTEAQSTSTSKETVFSVIQNCSLGAGDIVRLMGGGSFGGFPMGNVSGSIGNHIIFESNPGDTTATIDGFIGAANQFVRNWSGTGGLDGQNAGNTIEFTGSTSYITFRNLIFTNSNPLWSKTMGLDLTDSGDLAFFYSNWDETDFWLTATAWQGTHTDFTFDNIECFYVVGCLSGDADNVTVTNSYIHDLPVYGWYARGDNWVVRGNTFQNVAYGMQMYPTPTTDDALFEDNVFIDIGNAAWYFEPTDLVVRGGNGILVQGDASIIRNNVFCNVSDVWGAVDGSAEAIYIYAGDGGLVANNSIYRVAKAGVDSSQGTNTLVQNNVIVQAALVSSSAINGDGTDPSPVTNALTDIGYVNPSACNLHLDSEDNSGTVHASVTDDYDGVARGTPPDRGAFEFVAGGGGGGPITEVSGQTANNPQVSNGDDLDTLAFPLNVTGGNLLVVMGVVYDGDVTPADVTVTDTQGTSYVVITAVLSTIRIFIAHGIVPATGANVVTVNPDGDAANSVFTFSIDEFAGVDPATPPLDVNGGSSTDTGTAVSEDITTSAADDLILGVVGHIGANGSGIATGMGYTQIGEYEDMAALVEHNAQFQIVTTPQAYSVTWTMGESVNWVAMSIAIKPDDVGGGVGGGALSIFEPSVIR